MVRRAYACLDLAQTKNVINYYTSSVQFVNEWQHIIIIIKLPLVRSSCLKKLK